MSSIIIAVTLGVIAFPFQHRCGLGFPAAVRHYTNMSSSCRGDGSRILTEASDPGQSRARLKMAVIAAIFRRARRGRRQRPRFPAMRRIPQAFLR
jgi:hypothetical protein